MVIFGISSIFPKFLLIVIYEDSMREVVFLKKNEKKWRKTERLLANKEDSSPDLLADLFIELTDDLAFTQTHYPDSKTTLYLNDLTSQVYQEVYKSKKIDRNRFSNFWKYEAPYCVFLSRKTIRYTLIAFIVSVLIGALSTHYDNDFTRNFLGSDYVDTTIRNIENGDPMGIYKRQDESGMWLRIMSNNVIVSFLSVIYGFIVSVGAFWNVVHHGIMVGTFQYFFIQRGLFIESSLTIWLHGTIEITCLIVAGGAGVYLGNSFLFPGTFSRLKSLIGGAKTATKVIVGLVPFIVLAAFLESFATRHTEWHWSIRLGIILISLSLVLWYFWIYPRVLNKKGAFRSYESN